MRKTVLAVLASAVIASISAPAAEAVTIATPPSCSMFMESYFKAAETNDFTDQTMKVVWFMAYVSGIAVGRDVDALKIFETDDIVNATFLWIRKYCGRHPDGNLADAGDSYFDALRSSVENP